MTGFARVEGGDESLGWVWEARSVNGKGLDVRCRMPQGFDRLEQAARETAAGLMARGNVTLSLGLVRAETARGPAIDREALVRVAALARDLVKDLEGVGPPTLDGLLRLPGVLDTAGPSAAAVDDGRLAAIRAGLDAVLAGLVERRAAEGARLLEVVRALTGEIAEWIESAAERAAGQPETVRRRLAAQVEEMTRGRTPIDEDRLAQEIVLLASRADVREEIDRLRTHVAAVEDLLAGSVPPGRGLGFLCQELLREANTLCSKSADAGLTAIGLDLKVAIDRLREQALNVE